MKTGESKLQKACVKWFRLQYPKYKLLLFSVPNGGTRDAITAANLKAEGVVPGVADLILLYSNGFYPYLCFRFDTEERNTILGANKWQHSIESVGGRYLVVSNFDGFREAVNDYFKEGIKF